MSPTSSEMMDDFETALRDTLAEQASTVTSAPDALQQIRRRIDRGDTSAVRRPRSPWLGTRGAIAATAAVAAAAAAVGVVLSTGGGRAPQPTNPAHTPAPSVVPTPSRMRVTPSVLSYTALAGSKLVAVTGSDRQTIRLRPAGIASRLTDLESPTAGLIYGVRSQGNCGADLVRIRTDAPRSVAVAASPTAGFSVTGYAVDGSRLAVVETACDGSGGQIVASDQTTGASHTISWQGNPPLVVGNPAWAGPQSLDVVWKTGMEAAPLQIDPFTADGVDKGAPACGFWDSATYLPQDLQGQGTNVFVVAQSGGGTTVLTCDPSVGASVAFKLPGSVVATSALIQPNYHWRVLTADTRGRLWLWPGIASHKPHLLRNAPKGVTAVAW